MHTSFYKQRFCSTQTQCCVTFSWIEPQLFLRCHLMHISNIKPRHSLYLLYLCPCPNVGLFMSYLCDLFFIFIFIYIDIALLLLFFKNIYYVLLFSDDYADDKYEQFLNSEMSASGCCLAFTWFFANFSLTLLIKILLMKQACNILICHVT